MKHLFHYSLLLIVYGLGVCSCQTPVIPKADPKTPRPLAVIEDDIVSDISSIDHSDLPSIPGEQLNHFDPTGLKVFFALDSFSIDKRAMKTLKKISFGMKSDPFVRIIIRAHTDQTGSKKYNLQLSKKRALAIKNQLISDGIDGMRLRVDVVGELDPVGLNKRSRSLSRRAEFFLDESLEKPRSKS